MQTDLKAPDRLDAEQAVKSEGSSPSRVSAEMELHMNDDLVIRLRSGDRVADERTRRELKEAADTIERQQKPP